MGLYRVYSDNGKEKENYYLGFRVLEFRVTVLKGEARGGLVKGVVRESIDLGRTSSHNLWPN